MYVTIHTTYCCLACSWKGGVHFPSVLFTQGVTLCPSASSGAWSGGNCCWCPLVWWGGFSRWTRGLELFGPWSTTPAFSMRVKAFATENYLKSDQCRSLKMLRSAQFFRRTLLCTWEGAGSPSFTTRGLPCRWWELRQSLCV